MQLPLVAALAATAFGNSALAKLNPFDHPSLHARFDSESAGNDMPQMNAVPPMNTTTRFRNENTERK